MSDSKTIIRYSDEELQEFKELIEKKMSITQDQYQRLEEQIQETSENGSDEHGGDWVDDSGYNTDIEMLQTMAMRQRKYLQDLEAALLRIRNKTYGVCVNTGQLIDKKRLLAVPTTTKSLVAKGQEQKELEKKSTETSRMPYIKKKERKVISKVIKKNTGSSAVSASKKDEFYDDDDDDIMMDDSSSDHIDLDDIADSYADED